MEKRKYKRIPVKIELEISSLFKQDNEKISNVDAPIDVTNISRGGVGFISKSVLPEGFYFNARFQLTPDEESVFYSVIKIIRRRPLDDGNTEYGCEMVGFPSVLNYVFEDFEKRSE